LSWHKDGKGQPQYARLVMGSVADATRRHKAMSPQVGIASVADMDAGLSLGTSASA